MFDIESLITTGGLLLIAAIVFAESGMFVGFFFPGDTLLITAGVFAAQGQLPLVLTIIVIALAAIAGDNTGYHIGRRYGRKMFGKKDGLLFRKEYVDRAETFYKEHGGKAMLFAHFFPIIRTFAPPVAGVAHMNYKQFVIFDAIGDTAWAISVTLVGYWFGTKIPDLDHYILLFVAGAMVFTLAPTLYHLAKALYQKRQQRRIKAKVKSD